MSENLLRPETGVGTETKMRRDQSLQVYLKIIDYKRSVGSTQWTILTIFITACSAILTLGAGQENHARSILIESLGALTYWVGFILYRRYRRMNREVSRYLLELEQENGFCFQRSLENGFHKTRPTTTVILLIAGILYTLIAATLSLL